MSGTKYQEVPTTQSPPCRQKRHYNKNHTLKENRRESLAKSIIHFKDNIQEDALSNTKFFLMEDNNNYNLADEIEQEEINEEDLGEFEDPSMPSLLFRLFCFVLIILDCVLIISDLIIDCPPQSSSRIIGIAELGISIIFFIEIGVRIFALSPKVFFTWKHWFNISDFVIVLATFAMSLIYTMVIEQSISEGAFLNSSCEPEDDIQFLSITKVLVILRIFRFLRLLRLIRLYTEHYHIKRAIRQKVSQNKRRFQHGGVDLDLTYVTPRIIAMSFPSSGIMSWYRNPIREVSAFLNKHHGSKYRVYNLCNERTYNDTWFHNRVYRWPIDDHNVPTINEMVDFVEEVVEWLCEDEDHIIAVHCKGGKGRTGTMICILLIEFEMFRNATTSLEFFGQRRTDRNVSKQFQGVETASQIRYVTYFEKLRNLPQIYPEKVWLKLEKMQITGIASIGQGDGSDLSFQISMGRTSCLYLSNDDKTKTWIYDPAIDVLTIKTQKCPKFANDVRIKFFCSNNSVPKVYEHCAFFFWFHTFFINLDGPWNPPHKVGVCPGAPLKPHQRRLILKREEIDNPHKERTWKIYNENFQINLIFKLVDQ
eukprot:maker-scaffold587_size153100-snap-gene-0.27 protein:Tk01029 transcript:maker-scaffold587_size153100-snap-gene-0.27-mRNA-1 annotation:"voltage-sensor containing phosphatase"